MKAIITPKDFTRELGKLARRFATKSRFAGDSNFMRATSITGNGDYLENDAGMHWSD